MHWLDRARRLRRIAGDYYFVLKNEKRVSSNPPALWKRLTRISHGGVQPWAVGAQLLGWSGSVAG
jgi:hypothetical protein